MRPPSVATKGMRVCSALAFVALWLPLSCEGRGCGCGKSAATAAPSGSASASASAARPPPAPPLGPVGVPALIAAIRGIDLRESQRSAVDAAVRRLEPHDVGDAQGELQRFNAEIAEGIKLGTIEAPKLEAHFAVFQQIDDARHKRDVAVIGDLHAALDPAQRVSVVAAARERAREREAARRRPPEAHLNPARLRLERLLKDLDLDPPQKARVDAILPKAEGSSPDRDRPNRRLASILAAFEADRFDPKDILSPESVAAHAFTKEDVQFFATLAPLLKPEQRAMLATKLERQPGGPRAP